MKIPGSLRWKSTGKTLGQGGQGTVVEVTDTTGEISGTFALKGLLPGKPISANERFAREIEVIRSIKHPSIISVIDHSSPESDFPFYVMQLHPGATTLKRLIGTEENPFSGNPLKSLSLFIQILSALSACEEKGVVHRDLSPANILVLPDETIKIIDFGLCQIVDGKTVTLGDEGVGTPNYMAPECESGALEPVTIRADIYSAGKILWAAITGQHAFAREAPVFGHKAMQSCFPQDPTAWHLHHVFEKTIRHDLKDRWSTTSDALAATYNSRFLIVAGYPPLELMNHSCPFCGVGRLGPFEQSHSVFGNPNPPGIYSLQCDYCGFCFARNGKMVKESLAQRSKLA